jgi:UDP-N-acetylmuramoylalanine--D-glutamate ligase
VRFAEAIRNAQKGESWRDRVQVVCVETLLEAIASARGAARNGDTVLFSPAAPSFDAYVNYAARGQHFRALVSEL